jgi:HSP20 family molecular chaperone IbpA
MRTSTGFGPTDLGRRVRERRCQTGLSQESAAALAGMSASYLRYLETSPSAHLRLGGLARLADALGTSTEALSGAGLSQAPGPYSGQSVRIEEGIEDGRYVVRAELPGTDPEKQVKFTFLKGSLTIEAERAEAAERLSRSEFCYGTFTRHVALPENASVEDTEVSHNNGILEIRLRLRASDQGNHT